MSGRAITGLSSVFGYTIDSALAFTFLRKGQGDTSLTVTEGNGLAPPVGSPLLEWVPRPDRPRGARLYETGSRFDVWVDQSGWFHVDRRQGSIAVSPSADPLRREATLWGIPTALCFMERGDLALHAAAIEVGGSAIVLAGPGHSGKTTMACGFLQAGYRVLAEDISCCRPDEPAQLLPGPAMLRVRRDSYQRLDLTGSRMVAEESDRVTLALPESARGDAGPVPIRAILLVGSPSPSLSIEPVALPAAIRALWSLSFMLPRDADRARSFKGVVTIASAVPVWSFRWRRTFAEMSEAVTAIISRCRS